jgi:hypothetical protein
MFLLIFVFTTNCPQSFIRTSPLRYHTRLIFRGSAIKNIAFFMKQKSKKPQADFTERKVEAGGRREIFLAVFCCVESKSVISLFRKTLRLNAKVLWSTYCYLTVLSEEYEIFTVHLMRGLTPVPLSLRLVG